MAAPLARERTEKAAGTGPRHCPCPGDARRARALECPRARFAAPARPQAPARAERCARKHNAAAATKQRVCQTQFCARLKGPPPPAIGAAQPAACRRHLRVGRWSTHLTSRAQLPAFSSMNAVPAKCSRSHPLSTNEGRPTARRASTRAASTATAIRGGGRRGRGGGKRWKSAKQQFGSHLPTNTKSGRISVLNSLSPRASHQPPPPTPRPSHQPHARGAVSPISEGHAAFVSAGRAAACLAGLCGAWSAPCERP